MGESFHADDFDGTFVQKTLTFWLQPPAVVWVSKDHENDSAINIYHFNNSTMSYKGLELQAQINVRIENVEGINFGTHVMQTCITESRNHKSYMYYNVYISQGTRLPRFLLKTRNHASRRFVTDTWHDLNCSSRWQESKTYYIWGNNRVDPLSFRVKWLFLPPIPTWSLRFQ